jgi:M6 family metalloprotease-like protein
MMSFQLTLRSLISSAALLAVAGSASAIDKEASSLSNLSVRTSLVAGQTLIVGGVVSGGSKNFLVRAGGPALVQFGLPGMADPKLDLYTTGSAPVASNNDWATSLSTVFTSVGAFGFEAGSKDAALTQTIDGSFSALVSGATAGTVLVEAYDVPGGSVPRMINLSARNLVGTGANILIAGFSLAGTGKKQVLIRAVGPGLSQFGLTGVLADPLLRVFDASNTLVTSNDSWASRLSTTFTQVGAFALPAGSKDAALLATLNAGTSYTAQVSGSDGGTGEALVEVYEVVDPLFEARLTNTSSRSDVALGFPRFTHRLATTGNVRFKVIFVDFSDAAATRTVQSVFGLVNPAAAQNFAAMSYGKLNVTFDPQVQWLRMSKPSTGYGWSSLTFVLHKAYIQEAIDLAVAAGADFSSADAFLVMANPDATAFANGPAFCASVGNGVTANGRIFLNGATSGRDLLSWGAPWFNHEIGHSMSLVDLYAFTGSTHRFVGDFSLMGNTAGSALEFLAWERWQLGWLDDNQVVCAKPGVTSVTLSAIESVGGVKMVIAPLSATTAVIVESRRALGLDATITKAGPLVYYIDTSIASGLGPIKVLPIDESDRRKLTFTMSVGQTITYSGISVKYSSGDASAPVVEVTRP